MKSVKMQLYGNSIWFICNLKENDNEKLGKKKTKPKKDCRESLE